MLEYLLVALVSIVVLAVSAQWLAWRFRMPSILILLLLGFVAGPLTGFIVPDNLFGSLLFPIVSLSVGIILFEGGLSLRLEELHEAGKAVRNLVSIGVLITWFGSAAAAHYLAGLDPSLAILIGALLVVTGPTVIVPLLHHVRPPGRIGAVTKWEGIVIDPVGAILSVLVLEAVLIFHGDGMEMLGEGGELGAVVLQGLQGLVMTTLVSLGLAVLGVGALILLFHRRHVPDRLQNPMVLMVVSAAFAVANVLQPEAGLLTTTLMGVMMANQNYVPVRRISEFKEDLGVLLIGVLFIVLSARLELSALHVIDWGSLLFLLVLMVVVRPLAVLCSSIGTKLTWKEVLFLSWLAPRGIVAAAVVSLFSFDLQGVFPEQVDQLVPLVFLVIVGTVSIYGLTILPLARWLGLADPDPQGILIVGAHSWAQDIAEKLQSLGFKLLLVDASSKNVERARDRGLPAQQVDILSESAIDEIDFNGLGRLLTLTHSEKLNALAAIHFYEVFDSANIYQLSINDTERGTTRSRLPKYLRGHPLFGEEVTFDDIDSRLRHGAALHDVEFSESYTYDEFELQHGARSLPLFLLRANGKLYIYSDERPPTPESGDRIIAILDAAETPPSTEADSSETTDEAEGAIDGQG